jgi:hypothetical protein
LVWIRRVVFLLLIIIIVSGYYVITRTGSYVGRKEADKYANITARIWVATARFNDNPEQYRQYRDSLLKAENITKEELNDYLREYERAPEKYLMFITAVNFKVDSMINFEDSLLNPSEWLPSDSVLQVD